MSVHEHRLAALRRELAGRNLDGFVVPLTDEHLSEYVGEYARRLAWLTGFEGSAGFAVVLANEAAVFVDGRYTLQVRQQVDGGHWSYQSTPQTNAAKWLYEHVSERARIGFDPWLHVKGWAESVSGALAQRAGELVPVIDNPVDAVWSDRPRTSDAKLIVHPDVIAGKSSLEKRQKIADELIEKRVDLVVLSALDSVAWTFNLRGRDIQHTPVALAYALVHANGTADLFVSLDKLTNAVVSHLGDSVRLHSLSSFAHHLSTLTGLKVGVDSSRSVVAILELLAAAGASVIEMRDPSLIPKAVKNEVEIAGHKAAQVRDAVALSRFLHWVATEGPKGYLNELSAAARLREFREETGHLRDLSFATISAFGPNGALAHYCASEHSCRQLKPGSLYLVDSGGQYLDGTTDVTRTVAIGAPSDEMRDRFTRVLKGHIALAQAIFPAGTRTSQLDTLARQFLWAVGVDYAHGTGHGVGAYLCVHEGPQHILRAASYANFSDEVLLPGMILSNEPGYYKAGEYGMRLENLMLVVRRVMDGAEYDMLGFETLTYAPIDRSLIDASMLTLAERAWVDAYHDRVARMVGPHLDSQAKMWLFDATCRL